MTECKDGYNPVTRPEHYVQTEITPIDVIEAWAPSWPSGIAPHVANVVKYACRFSSKGSPIEDLKKMAWYAQRAVEVLERVPPLKSWRELAGTDTPLDPEPIPEPCEVKGPKPGSYVEVTEGACALQGPDYRERFHKEGVRGWLRSSKNFDLPYVRVRTCGGAEELYAVAVTPVSSEEPEPEVTYREGGDLDPAPKDGLLCGDYVEVTSGPTELPPGSRDLYHRKGTRGWVCLPKEGDKPFVRVRTSADPDSERYAVAVRLIEGSHEHRSK